MQKKTIILNLKNYSTTTSATVIFSVEGGFIGNTLVKSKGISIPTSTSLCSYTPNQAFNFTYANSSQVFDTDFCDGVYMVQLWGSSGKDVGSDGLSNSLGYGGYTAGKIRLEKSLVLYINVGHETIVSGHHTYNGGAVGEAIGGGATDIRLKSTSWNDSIGLNSRIMVAGGGGGAMYNNHLTLVQSGDAGGLIGYDAIANHDNPSRNDLGGHGGTQTAGGAGGTAISNWDPLTSNATGVFGAGGYGLNSNGGSPSSGGGGGYYGGGHGYHPGATWTGGGGGSSYISGHTGCVAVTSETNSSPKNGCVTSNTNYDCSVHYSKLYFYDTVMIDGKGYSWNSAKAAYVGQIQPDGSTTKGHYGTGYARITYLGD